jgi:uncharacterized phage-associated protein
MIVDAACDFFIERPADVGRHVVTPLSIEKLLYYAQGWSLAIRDEPLFTEEIQAWRYGPVIPSAYRRFRGYKSGAIPRSAVTTKPTSLLSDSVIDLLAWVWDRYGIYSGPQLIEMTHAEEPWRETWGGRDLEDEGHDIIPLERMSAFFHEQFRKMAIEAEFAPVGDDPKFIDWAKAIPAN